MVGGISLRLLSTSLKELWLFQERPGGCHLSIALPLRMETFLLAMAMLCPRLFWDEALRVEFDKHSS